MTGRFRLKTALTVPRKGWLYLLIPDELLDGVRKRVWIKGTLNRKPFTATANPWKQGTHVVTVNKQMRRALGIDGPIEVDLEAEVVEEPILDIEIPADLAEAIEAEPAARRTFRQLPPSRQKEFVFYVIEVKRAASRTERIRRSVAILRQGRHLWESPARRFAVDLEELQ